MFLLSFRISFYSFNRKMCCMRGQLRILAFQTLPVAFIHLCVSSFI
ncbi:hypothetical protein T05_382 [Trichinella murrelli]|uniref:Uncharacterized protein n=1 Tax=Trichinella murrelli TaxID=144512 RepID=A0A0V0SQX7_9BILA|nr:hypothetical protein T05_382 [Trichinella murrelli]